MDLEEAIGQAKDLAYGIETSNTVIGFRTVVTVDEEDAEAIRFLIAAVEEGGRGLMERTEMLETLDDLHGDMVFVDKYGSYTGGVVSGVNFTAQHREALRQAILELKGVRVKQASDMPDEEEDNA